MVACFLFNGLMVLILLLSLSLEVVLLQIPVWKKKKLKLAVNSCKLCHPSGRVGFSGGNRMCF